MEMIKREHSSNLEEKIRKQMHTLFVGAIVNDTSLVEYAQIKKAINFNKGYSFNQFCMIQKHIGIVKLEFPALYNSYRVELISKIQNRRQESVFSICDLYVRIFSKMRIFNHSEINKYLLEFSFRE